MNKKGFTMIELLGVITILGVLMIIGISAVSRYLTKTRTEAYNILLQTSAEAAESKMLGTTETPPITYDIHDLAEEGYMDAPMDPYNQGKECKGTVTIEKDEDSNYNPNTKTTSLETYKYEVHIKCSNQEDTVIFDSNKNKTKKEA